MGLYDVIRDDGSSVANSFSFAVFPFFPFISSFFFCCAKNRISKSPPFIPPNPHRKQETRARWLKCRGGFTSHLDRSIFHQAWRKRDVEWRCGESRWINLCLVTIHRSHEVIHSPSIFCQTRSSLPHLRSCGINNYVCCARNVGRLINCLLAFTQEWYRGIKVLISTRCRTGNWNCCLDSRLWKLVTMLFNYVDIANIAKNSEILQTSV